MDKEKLKAAAASAQAELQSVVAAIDALDGASDGKLSVKAAEQLHPVLINALVAGAGFIVGISFAAGFLKRLFC